MARTTKPGLASAIRACEQVAVDRSPQVRQTTSVEAAVQLDDVAAAGGLVEAVDVLGDDRVEDPVPLEVGDGVVRRRWARRA